MPARQRQPAFALAVVCLGSIAAPLDSSVNIAFPSIARDLGFGVSDIRWVIIAYVLTYASLMLIFGKLGDLLGYRRIFQSGLVIATIGFVACAAAPTLGWLLPGRVLQGVGIALTWSCAPALATSLYAESERTRILALYGAAMAAGAALGPLAGGFLVETFGWPVVFWARAPLVGTALLLSWLIPAGAQRATTSGFDWLGALLLVVWMAAFLLAAARPNIPIPIPVTLPLVGVGVAALVAFLWHETRHPEPIVRLSHFANGDFLMLNIASIMVNLAGFAVMLLVPFHIVRTLGLAPGVGGLVLGVNAVGIIVGSWIAGQIAPRIGQGRLAMLGTGVSVAGLSCVGATGADTPLALAAAALLVQGLGLGLFQIAYTDAVIAHLPKSERGVAGSLTMVTRTIGVIGAATGLTALHGWLEAGSRAGGADDAAAFHQAFVQTFGLVAGTLALCLVAAMLRALVLGARRRPPSTDSDA